MEKKVTSIKQIIYNKEWLEDWLSTATYQNPWFAFGTHKDTNDEVYAMAKQFNEYREGIWAFVLLHGGKFLVEDCEEEKDYCISMTEVEKGFKIFMLNYPKEYAALMTEEGDLYDADALMQCIVFGEVIYG